MIGKKVTIRRERPDLRRSFETRGTVLDVNTDDQGRVIGARVKGVNESGRDTHTWWAVGPDGLAGSLVTSQSCTVDACGHDMYACRCV